MQRRTVDFFPSFQGVTLFGYPLATPQPQPQPNMASAPSRPNAALPGHKQVKLTVQRKEPWGHRTFVACEIAAESTEIPGTARQLAMSFNEAVLPENAAYVDAFKNSDEVTMACGSREFGKTDKVADFARVAGCLDWVAEAFARECTNAHIKFARPCTMGMVERRLRRRTEQGFMEDTPVAVNRMQPDPTRVVFLVALPPPVTGSLTFDFVVPDGMAIDFHAAHHNRGTFFKAWHSIGPEFVIPHTSGFLPPAAPPKEPAPPFEPCAKCARVIETRWAALGLTDQTKMCMLCGACFEHFKATLADKPPPATFTTARASPFVPALPRTSCPLEAKFAKLAVCEKTLSFTWE